MDLTDRIARVTVASRGIGRKIAQGLAAQGCHGVLVVLYLATLSDRSKVDDPKWMNCRIGAGKIWMSR